MTDPEVIIVPIVFGLPTVAFIVRTIARHRERMAEIGARQEPSSSAVEERLSRVEHTVDAIALEMERVGEGQRFLTKVLTQRELPGVTPPSPSAAPHTITPH